MCGAPNEEDGVYCGNCGAILNPDEVPAATEAEITTQASADDQLDADEYVKEVPSEVEAEDEIPQPPALNRPPPPPPPPAAPGPPAPPVSGMAIASLVLGIGGLTILPLLGSIVAIVLGYMARSDIRQRPGEVTGDGLALAGIVMGWIAVVVALLGILAFGAFTVCGLCGALGLGASGY
jgi:hypothetical protein